MQGQASLSWCGSCLAELLYQQLPVLLVPTQQKGKLRHRASSTWLGGTRSGLAWASHGRGHAATQPCLQGGGWIQPLGSKSGEPVPVITLTRHNSFHLWSSAAAFSGHSFQLRHRVADRYSPSKTRAELRSYFPSAKLPVAEPSSAFL